MLNLSKGSNINIAKEASGVTEFSISWDIAAQAGIEFDLRLGLKQQVLLQQFLQLENFSTGLRNYLKYDSTYIYTMCMGDCDYFHSRPITRFMGYT